MSRIRAASQPINLQLLLFQYDPILQKSLVDTAGLIQSIIYELIYEKVIHPDILHKHNALIYTVTLNLT